MKFKRQKSFFIFFLVVCFGFCHRAIAQGSDSSKNLENVNTSTSWQDQLIMRNIEVSSVLDGWAEDLDLYLVGRKVTSRKNETSLKIENSTFVEKGLSNKNTTHFNLNVQLPNLEDFWQLKFTSYDEAQERRGINRGYSRQTQKERNYGASVGVFQDLGNIRTRFTPRIELQNPLRVSHTITFEAPSNDHTTRVFPKFELFANPDKGTGTFGSLNFLFILSPIYAFSVLNEGEYEERQNLFTTSIGFSLKRTLDDRRSISQNLFFTSESRPVYHLSGYSYSWIWSELIYRKIFDYQIIPHVDFDTATLEAKGGLIVNLNLNF